MSFERPVNLCLFCLQDASSSEGESHIVPESLGNSATHVGEVLALPPGSVCDSCNSGRFGAKVEASFLQDDAGILARFRGIPSKRGRYPTASLRKDSTTIAFTYVAGGLELLPPSMSAGRVPIKTLRSSPSSGSPPPDAEPTARFDLKHKLRPKHHYTSALVSKLLVEYIAHSTSKGVALHPALDVHRTNALHASQGTFLPYYRGTSDLAELFQVAYSIPNNLFSFTYSNFLFLMPILVPATDAEYPDLDDFELVRGKSLLR